MRDEVVEKNHFTSLKRQRGMFSWINSKLEIRNTDKYGKGVFAKEDIKRGEMFFVMGGYALSEEQRV